MNVGEFLKCKADYELMKCHVSDQKSSFWYIIQFVQNFNFILTSSWMHDGTYLQVFETEGQYFSTWVKGH